MALVGETAFLTTYFVGGISGRPVLSSALFRQLQATHFSVVVGASGAIYALGGLLMVMRPNTRVMTFPNTDSDAVMDSHSGRFCPGIVLSRG